jgi:hypothetical protein
MFLVSFVARDLEFRKIRVCGWYEVGVKAPIQGYSSSTILGG